MFHKKTYSVIIITTFLIFFSFICFGKAAFSTQKGKLFLQIVKQPEEKILVEFRIEKGDCFYLDYTHSSDLTPVHDIFQIDKKGIIVLIEEDYLWYGSGLEFHPEADAKISFKDNKTRVYLHREFYHFLLRVGRVANHVITYKEKKIPLKEIAEGGNLVWIRVIRK